MERLLSKYKLRWLINSGFVVVLTAIFLLAVISYQNIQKSMLYDSWVSHTHKVIHKFDQLLSALIDAENGQRGYIATGDTTYLQPYNESINKIPVLYEDLRQLTNDNLSQEARLKEIDSLVKEKQRILQKNIDLVRTGGKDAVNLVDLKRGKEIMDAIRDKIANAGQEESLLLQERAQLKAKFSSEFSNVLVAGAIFGLIDLIIIFILFRKEIIARRTVEDSLRESSTNYRNLLNVMYEAYCTVEVVFDSKGIAIDFRYLDTNEVFEKSTGLHNVSGKFMHELEPRHEQLWYDIYGRVALSGIPEQFEYEAKALGRYFKQSAFRIGGPGSRKVGILINDISLQHQAELKLQQSEKRLSALINSISQTVYRMSPDWKIMYSLSGGNFIPTTISENKNWLEEYIPEKSRHIVVESINKAIDTKSVFDLEHEVIQLDGNIGWTHSTAIPLLDEQGEIIEWFGAAFDLTQRKKAEEALRLSQERLSALINAVSQSVYRMSPEWKIMYSLSGGNFIPSTLNENKNWLEEYIPEKSKPIVLKTIQKAIESKSMFDLEHEVIQIDGTIGWTHSKAIPLLNEQGEITEWFGAATDITQRKRTEEALRKSEQRLKALLKATSNAIYRMSPNWDTLYLLSGEFLNEAENQPYKPEEYIPADNLPKVLETVSNAVKNKSLFDLEHQVFLPDRTIGWTRSRAIPILNEEGEIEEWFGFAEDITKRKKAEEELRRNEQRWITTLSSLNEAVIATDAEGKVTFINSEAECLTGWSRREVLDHSIEDFYKVIDESFRTAKQNPVEYVIKNGIKYRAADEIFLIRKQGEKIPIEEAGAPIIERERIIGTVLIFHDVTERKSFEKKLKEYNALLEEKVRERTSELVLAKEQAESADKLKTSFLLAMSHELRTPLNSIIGFSGILNQELAGTLNQEQKKQTTMILQSGRHLLHLVNDILDLSKIEVGELKVNFELFNVGDSIEHVFEIEKIVAEGKGLSLQLNRSGEAIIAESDPARFQQVILNLVHNAIKFTDQGVVSINYWMENSKIYVAISDTGIGIKEENLPKLFISFSRLQEDELVREHRGTGSGLGLAISKKIMDLLHGSISVKSKYGEGSVFTVILPLSSRMAVNELMC